MVPNSGSHQEDDYVLFLFSLQGGGESFLIHLFFFILSFLGGHSTLLNKNKIKKIEKVIRKGK